MSRLDAVKNDAPGPPNPASISVFYCEKLLREHYLRIYNYLFHLCRDEQWAEDLCQETFAKAWKSRDGFHRTASVLTWIFRIARNSFLDDVKHRNRIRHTGPVLVEWNEEASEAPHPGPLPPETLMRREQSEILSEAIQNLPEHLKTAVLLHYREGMSYRQLAKVLEIPVGTAKYHVSQGVAELRQLLKQWEGKL